MQGLDVNASAAVRDQVVPPHRFYYLHNFAKALDWIRARYGDILQPDEQRFITAFRQLPQPSQALLVRLLMRKGPWFRVSKLVYDEIPDVVQAAQPLLNVGWLVEDAPLALDELCGLLNKPELVELFAHCGVRASMRKAELLAHVSALDVPAQPLGQWLSGRLCERAWRVELGALSQRLRVMFFGNLYQDWSEFVLADLGIFQYEVVPFDASSRAFQCREDVDTYLRLQACRDQIDEGLSVQEVEAFLQEAACANAWLEARRQKILYRLGQACEKAQDYALAERTYASCTYAGARHRHIRVLEKMGKVTQALALAETAHCSPESADEQQKIARMLPRLRRSAGDKVAMRKALSIDIAQLRWDVELPLLEGVGSVEYVLRAHWHSAASPVFYVENTLFNALFGLLFWDAVFAPVQGAFFHPFQSAPADFGAPDFVARRQAWFDQGMRALDDGSYVQTIWERFAHKQGVISPYVAWSQITPELLELALQCIPVAHLRAVFGRMQADVKNHRTGFPDLIRFWPQEARYELVEAKAPGDKLQDNQILWLEHFVAHGIPARVCHVHWRVDSRVDSPAEAL